jgi:glutathione S-transferase
METAYLLGRSSSHFTRVARIFALELGVAHDFRAVLDLTTLDPSAYARNPALKIPVWVDEQGSLFGAENICHALRRRSGKTAANVILRGELPDRAIANAEELTLHVMSCGVSLIMAKASGSAAPPKVAPSLHNGLGYLDETLPAVLAALPASRLLSFFEVALFCVVTHLKFRDVADASGFRCLQDFCLTFAERDSAKATHYRFDPA